MAKCGTARRLRATWQIYEDAAGDGIVDGDGEESTKSRIPYTAQHCAWMEAVSHLAVMLEAAVDTDI